MFNAPKSPPKTVYDKYLKRDEDSRSQRQMTKEIRIFGFSIYFLLFLIAAKIVYILVEMIYNSIVVDGNSTLGLSIEELQNIEHLGLLVSTTGFILLILPLIYKFSHYFTLGDVRNAFLRAIFIVTSSFFIFLFVYNSLQSLTNYIIDRSKDERYNAYYLTMLKDGMLNNILSYTSFIVNEHEGEKTHVYSVEDKIVGLNLYLLLHIDDQIINKMVDKGIDNIYRFRLKEFIESDYALKEAKIINLGSRVRYFWHKYNLLKEEANEETSHLKDPEITEQKFHALMQELQLEYEVFKMDQEHFKNRVQISLNPTTDDTAVLQKQWESIHGTADFNIASFEDYLRDEAIKIKIATVAQKQFNIRLGYEFNGTLESFTPYYHNSIDLLSQEIIYRKVEKKLGRYGLRDVSLDYDWDAFVTQPFIMELLKKRIDDDALREKVLSIIKDQNMHQFFDEIYLPEVEKLLKKSIYISKESFRNDPASQQIGDDALRLLYIPPLAIFFSSVFGVLNMIVLIAYVLLLFWWYYSIKGEKLNRFKLARVRGSFYAVQLAFAAVLIYIPIKESVSKTEDYPILHQLFTVDAQQINKPFLYTMQWLLSSEPFIYNIGKRSRQYLDDEFLATYGIQKSDK